VAPDEMSWRMTAGKSDTFIGYQDFYRFMGELHEVQVPTTLLALYQGEAGTNVFNLMMA
jgi:hypothetical protein